VVDKVERLTVFGGLDGLLRDVAPIDLPAHRARLNRNPATGAGLFSGFVIVSLKASAMPPTVVSTA
jgi:hypothetical protein